MPPQKNFEKIDALGRVLVRSGTQLDATAQ